ncbi:MAG: VanW family protein, partial [Eubacterium sp.]|nr:VanW family protein [Eubacterium sp.]
YDSRELKSGVDYKMSASNYDKAGVKSAKVVFEGLGNFKGTKTIYVNVYPNKVKSLKTKSRTPSSVELTWASQKNVGVSGYRVYICDKNGKNSSLYKTVSSNSCNVTGRKAGTYYYFYVIAIKTSGSTKVSGEASNVFKTCTKPSQVKVNFVTKSKDKKSLKIEWQKVNCTGYELEYSTDKNFKKGVKKVIINGASKTSKKVSIKKSDKTYYARVRAFRKYNNGKTTVYGKRSAKISSSFSKLYASYTTNYVYNPPRTVNLKLACKAINGKIVYPGEVFSFNQTVGRRTEAKGYKEAYVFTGPTTHQMGVGGGVCQVASTMFNAALRANFGIVERHQHSQRVTYCPLGRDAAIYWGSEDFKFRNTTNYPIKIKMRCGDGSLTCSYYVCYNVSHKKVDLSVSRNGNRFTLKRKVGGKVNYTAYSTY